jgi:hypothetical protein
MVDPRGLDVIAAEGVVDIYAIPSLDSEMLIRKGGEWSWLTNARRAVPTPWNKQVFLRRARRLFRLAQQ